MADELLPVLVAQLAVEEARDVLLAVARRNRVAIVPLVQAPMDNSLHALEVYTPGSNEPLRLLAEPKGSEMSGGFPLKLRLRGDITEPPPGEGEARPEVLDESGFPASPFRPVTETNRELSARHRADLAGQVPTPDAEDLVGRSVGGGKYEVQELLGIGAFGRVYRARHRELRKMVALKALHATFQQDAEYTVRFYGEALAASRLDHINITRVLDYGQESNGLLYIVMEYLAGETLAQRLVRTGPLALESLVDIMMQVGAGLSRAHEHDIVHRDVKPENIVLVTSRNDDDVEVDVVKICDFGIAQGQALDDAQRAAGGQVLGTPAYMSPEQCDGGKLDERADVYACGVTMYELATGRLPFLADDPIDVMRMHVLKEPVPPSRLTPSYFDPRLERVILKAMQKERAQRPQSMRELRGLLRDLLVPQEAPAADGPVSGPESIRGPVSARRSPPPDAVLDPEQMLQVLATTTDAKRLVNVSSGLEKAMMTFARRSEVTPLAGVVEALERIANGAAPGDRTREELAARALRTLADPVLLGPIAEIALASSTDEIREVASWLVLRQGGIGAHALCAARAQRRNEPMVRIRFVAMMREVGPPAWPALLGALERLEPSPGTSLDAAVAEDVLRSVPNIKDEAAGNIVARFVRHPSVLVARAAIEALVSLWGARARPMLIGVLDNADDVVRVAALGELRKNQWVDEHVVRRVDRMLSRATPASDELRAAAAASLTDCDASTRALSASILVRVLARPTKPGVLSRLRGVPPDSPLVLVATARALLALSPSAAGPIEECAAQSDEPLRSQLRELRGGPSP